MTRKAHSIEMLEEALDRLGIRLSSVDIRRLHYFTRDAATRTATVKALRNAVAQYRLDPLKLLAIKGVGIKTLHSVQLLSDIFAGQEVKKEFGHSDNLVAVQSILRTMRRGIPDEARTLIDEAANKLIRVQNMLQFDKMPSYEGE